MDNADLIMSGVGVRWALEELLLTLEGVVGAKILGATISLYILPLCTLAASCVFEVLIVEFRMLLKPLLEHGRGCLYESLSYVSKVFLV